MTEQFMTPNPWSSQDTICIPEHACLNNGNPNIPAEMLSRGTLILGETGSGKTVSAVVPILKGILRHGHDETQCAVLVIDPKRELLSVVQEAAAERLIVVGGDSGPRVDFFEGVRGKISMKEALEKALRLTPQGDAIKSGRGDNAYWNAAGYQLVAALTELVGELETSGTTILEATRSTKYWPTPNRANDQHPDVVRFLRLVKFVKGYWEPDVGEDLKAFIARIRVYCAAIQQHAITHQLRKKITRRSGQHADVMRVVRLMSRFIRSYGMASEATGILESWTRRLSEKADAIAAELWESAYPEPMTPVQKRLIEALDRVSKDPKASWFSNIDVLLSQMLKALEGGRDSSSADFKNIGVALCTIAEEFNRFDISSALSWTQSSDTKSSYWYASIGSQFTAQLTDRSLANRLWLNPVMECPDGFSVQESMNKGRVIVYQPAITETAADNAFGRVLKSLWFKSTFTRTALERGIAYAADEFQRFASSDDSSEAHYVDRCRAYRGVVVLATQSIASLRLQLHRADKSVTQAEASAALDVLLANLSNKFFFRSTDIETIAYLRRAFPCASGQHVTEVRPVTSFPPGCCYFMCASGSMGIRQIHLAEPQAPRRAA